MCAGFEMASAKGDFLMTCHAAKQKISKFLKDFPFGDVFITGDRQNASCRIKSMGTVRLAINKIAGLTDLFCMELLSASFGNWAINV